MVTRSTGAGRQALVEFIADDLRLGLTSAAGLEPATRSQLLGLLDDLVEVANDGADDREPGDATPFDPIYLAVER
jgi:hypothetical protein